MSDPSKFDLDKLIVRKLIAHVLPGIACDDVDCENHIFVTEGNYSLSLSFLDLFSEFCSFLILVEFAGVKKCDSLHAPDGMVSLLLICRRLNTCLSLLKSPYLKRPWDPKSKSVTLRRP